MDGNETMQNDALKEMVAAHSCLFCRFSNSYYLSMVSIMGDLPLCLEL